MGRGTDVHMTYPQSPGITYVHPRTDNDLDIDIKLKLGYPLGAALDMSFNQG